MAGLLDEGHRPSSGDRYDDFLTRRYHSTSSRTCFGV
jgi:hypothetical protein